jgi:hypothetical protein
MFLFFFFFFPTSDNPFNLAPSFLLFCSLFQSLVMFNGVPGLICCLKSLAVYFLVLFMRVFDRIFAVRFSLVLRKNNLSHFLDI